MSVPDAANSRASSGTGTEAAVRDPWPQQSSAVTDNEDRAIVTRPGCDRLWKSRHVSKISWAIPLTHAVMLPTAGLRGRFCEVSPADLSAVTAAAASHLASPTRSPCRTRARRS